VAIVVEVVLAVVKVVLVVVEGVLDDEVVLGVMLLLRLPT